ncbi:tetrapyrrole biosynthesis, uroporphyrinogen III synthase, partial [Baffinella frigidus]
AGGIEAVVMPSKACPLLAGGIEPVFMPSKATGKNLADEIPGPSANGRVLYPASAKARSEVQGGLTMRGFSCTRLNTYDTVSAVWDAEQLRLAKLVDVVALASPSAVKTWTERVGTSQRCACIGSTSAKSCEEAGFEHVFFPSHPGVEGWATSVFEALQLEKTQP